MSNKRFRVEINGIDSREEVDALEGNLKQLETLEVHTVGLDEVEISYDQNRVDPTEIERAIQRAGGTVRSVHLMD